MNKAQYLLGLFFILLVNVLWVLSGFLVRLIFKDKQFQSPFLVTYFSTALFTVYLIPFWPFLCNHCNTPCNKKREDGQESDNLNSLKCSKNKSPVYHTEPLLEEHVGVDTLEVDTPYGGVTNQQRVIDRQRSTQRKHEASGGKKCCGCFVVKQYEDSMSLRQTAKLSGIFCFIWFSMNLLYTESLRYTTLGSNTVLSTLSGPFCLILSMIFLKEPLVWSNIMGVAVVVAGAYLIEKQDISSNNNSAMDLMLGDSMAIVSAFIYGCYTTLMKFLVKDDSKMSTSLFFGLVGLFNVICLWPLFFFFHYSSIEPQRIPDLDTIGLLTLTGFVNILSDYFWARSILLTSPLIASVGLCLTIPLALFADFFFSDLAESFLYIVGAACVVVGFVLVNLKATQSLESKSDIRTSPTTEKLLHDM